MPKELVLYFLLAFFCFQLIFLLPAGSSGHCFLLRGKSESGPRSTCKHCLPPWSRAKGNRAARRYFLILCGLTGAWAQTEVWFKSLALESMLLGGKVNRTAQFWVCFRPQMLRHSNNKQQQLENTTADVGLLCLWLYPKRVMLLTIYLEHSVLFSNTFYSKDNTLYLLLPIIFLKK